MIQLRLGRLPIAVDPAPLMQHLFGLLGTPHTTKERALRAALRGVMILALDLMDGEIRRQRLPLPPPNCPKGMDLLEYGSRYLALLLTYELGGQTFALEYEESGDGIVVTGLAPAAALPGAAAAAAAADSRPDAAALPAPADAEPAGGGDRSELS